MYLCNEFTGHLQLTCGNWVPLGPTAPTDATLGTLAGEDVAANPKTLSQCSTMWMATSTGRLFITANADAEPDTAVTFTRIDTSCSK